MHAKGRNRFLLKKPSRDLIHAAATSAALALFFSPASGAANVTSAWKGDIAGNWNQIADWTNNPGTVIDYPHNGATNIYDVQIGGGSIALNVSPTVKSLTLSGGSIMSSQSSFQPGTNVVSVTDFINYSGSNVRAYVPMQVAGDLIFSSTSGSSVVSGAVTVGGSVTFPNSGAFQLFAESTTTTIDLQPTGSCQVTQPLTLANPTNSDPFSAPAFGRFKNGGVFDQSSNAPIIVGKDWSFTSTGTMHLNSTFAVTAINMFSTGVLDLQSSTAALTMAYGGGFSGSVNLAPGSTITLNGGTMSLSNINFVNSGTINIASWLDINTPTTIPGVLNFNTNTARIDLNANATFTGPVTFTDGLIKGPNRLSASNMNFMAGTISGAELFVPAGGTLNLTTAAARKLDLATLTIEGTANWNAGSLVTTAATISHAQILAAGTLNIPSSASATLTRTNISSGYDLLDNAGLLNIDHALLTIGEGWHVNNQQGGTIRAVGGTAALSLTSFTNSGVIDLQGSQVPVRYFNYSNADATFFNTATGSLLIDATSKWTYAQFSSGGVINNAGLISVNGGSFSTPGGILINSGNITLSGGSLTGANLKVTNSGTIELSGTAAASISMASMSNVVTFSNSATASITVGQSASLSLQGTSSIFSNAGLISADHAVSTDINFASIINNGIIRSVAAPLNITFGMNATNSGTIDLQSGAKGTIKGGFNLNLAAGSSLLIDGGATSVAVQNLTNAGLISVQHTTLTSTAGTFTNNGLIQISDGTATFPQIKNSGKIQITSGAASFDNQSASSNPGTIDFGAGGAAVFTVYGTDGLTAIRSQIISGHLTASPSDEDPTTALASARVIQIGAESPWHGVQLYGNSILVMRTFAGDANLDGVVNFADLVAVAQNYGIGNGSANWTSGDFNYDGNVNFADLVAIAQHYGDSMPPTVPAAPIEFQSDLAAAFASVPEPGIPTVLLGSLMVLTRRNARRRL